MSDFDRKGRTIDIETRECLNPDASFSTKAFRFKHFIENFPKFCFFVTFVVALFGITFVICISYAEDIVYAGPTQQLDSDGRIADPDTRNTYVDNLLGGDEYGSLIEDTSDETGATPTTNGSRYAGRL